MSEPLLALDSYTRTFGERTVLQAASVWATPGRITALMGRNGSGKSTLIRVGLGLLPAAQGVTHWQERVWQRPRLHELARAGLFYMPDRGLLSRRLRVGDQLELYAAAYDAPLADTVQALELSELLDLHVGELSGGEERRAELALARLRRPRCLICDEPFAGVAPMGREQLAAALREHAERGAAVLLTGHEVEDLLELADEVVWMVGGRTHVLGSPAAARSHHQFRREYLGPNRGIA